MATIHSLADKRSGVKVTVYDKAAKVSWEIVLPAMRVLHWKDNNTQQIEALVASLAVVDDEDPTQMGVNFTLADCLVRDPRDDVPGVHSYYMRPQFLESFNEGLKELNQKEIPLGATVLVQAPEIFAMWFNRMETICGTDYSVNTVERTDLVIEDQ